MRRQIRKSSIGQLVAAACGGAIVAGALLVLGFHRGDTVTTVVEDVPHDAAPQSGLTPREIYARDAAGVVFVAAKVVEDASSPFDVFGAREASTQTGSGFVVRANGTILTNAHVIDGAVKITVEFAGGRTVPATVIGKDPDDDLALLKVKPGSHRLDVLPLGDSDSVAVGDPTVAIGNPFDLQRTLTTGVVSGLQRDIKAPNGFTVGNVIQTDAPINPGSSGGPLIDSAGRVIGITSQIETAAGEDGNVGIGFAIPIDTARYVIPMLERYGRVIEGYLGVATESVTPALAALGLGARSGALVESVAPGSPAARAGLVGSSTVRSIEAGLAQVRVGGDIIVSIDGHRVRDQDQLESSIIHERPGTTVTLGIVRGTRRLRLAVTLGQRPETLPSSG